MNSQPHASGAIRLCVLNSHPIQYFAPLYKNLAADDRFAVEVLYCSPHGLSGETDRQFGTSVQWDIPLLDGYAYRFLSNQSPRPSIYSFWGLLNLSVIKALWQAPKQVVVVYGWAYAVCWVAIIAAKLRGHTVCMRAESPLRFEVAKSPFRQQLRRWVFGQGLFRLIDHFLYLGEQNKAFYTHMGVPNAKLVFAPYAVDNERFQQAATQLIPLRVDLRAQLGIPTHHHVLLCCGKYIAKKRPLDLLQAVVQLQRTDISVVMLGDGELRPTLEAYIAERDLTNVRLTGFVNQSEISRYYALADVFVMCSDEAETWGLAANEAMNFGLPVVISAAVGCADDLAIPEQTGYRYPCGNVAALAGVLNTLLHLPDAARSGLRLNARSRINQYSYEQILTNLYQALTPTEPQCE